MNTKILSIIAIFISLSSCTKKEVEDSNQSTFNPLASLSMMASGYDLTPASQDIADDMLVAERELAIIHTSNFGETVDVIAGGTVSGGPTLYINNLEINPYTGQSYLVNDVPISFFNQTVDLKDASQNTILSLQVPKIIQAEKLGSPNSIIIDINDETILKWTHDDTNPTGQVAIKIDYYENTSLNGAPLDSKLFIVDDNAEEFDLSTDFITASKAIKVNLVRGNAKNFSDANGSKVFFNARSTDHHYYIIE